MYTYMLRTSHIQFRDFKTNRVHINVKFGIILLTLIAIEPFLEMSR